MGVLMQQIDALGLMVVGLLREALDAFVRMDMEAALKVARKDKDIDKRYFELLSELIANMKPEPADIDEFQSLIWVIRALERIGDHAKNICEYIVYLVRGKDVRHTTIDEIEQQLGV